MGAEFIFFGNSSQSSRGRCLPLHTDGRLIRNSNNEIFSVSGLTAFPFINRFARGEDVSWIQQLFPDTNLLRVFWYTPQDEWGDKYWDLPTPQEAFDAHAYAADRGIYLYNTCLTDDASDSKLQQIKEIIAKLRNSSLPNVLFESKNEPGAKDSMNPSVLKNDLNNTPYLYTSGIYAEDQLPGFWGRFGNNHCPRDAESVRKFADLEGLYDLNKVPWFEGEPFKLPGYVDLDFYTFAAGTRFMGSGGIYHCQSMEYLNRPNPDELRCSNLFLHGLNVFPLDTQLGSFTHCKNLEGIINEGTPDERPTTCLRCYQKGNYAIVVRKESSFKVPSNWQSLDIYGVGYKIL